MEPRAETVWVQPIVLHYFQLPQSPRSIVTEPVKVTTTRRPEDEATPGPEDTAGEPKSHQSTNGPDEDRHPETRPCVQNAVP